MNRDWQRINHSFVSFIFCLLKGHQNNCAEQLSRETNQTWTPPDKHVSPSPSSSSPLSLIASTLTCFYFQICVMLCYHLPTALFLCWSFSPSKTFRSTSDAVSVLNLWDCVFVLPARHSDFWKHWDIVLPTFICWLALISHKILI